MIAIPALEGKSIDLNITPQDVPMARTTQIDSKEDYDRYTKWTASFANKAYFFIDVWNLHCVLSVFIFDDKGYSGHVERLSNEDQATLGITDDMLSKAIEDQGGAIDHSSHYRISKEIKQKLAEAL